MITDTKLFTCQYTLSERIVNQLESRSHIKKLEINWILHFFYFDRMFNSNEQVAENKY